MKEIAIQKKGDMALILEVSEDDWAEYEENQPLKAKVTGFKKPRSVKQLNIFMACCKLVSENTENPAFDTLDKVKFQTKVALHFVDQSMVAVRPDGQVSFQYRSLSFANLKHMEACKFFDRAFEYLASILNVSVEALIAKAKSRMKSYK